MGNSLTTVTDTVAGQTIYAGTIGTMNRVAIVSDSPALINADGVTTGTDSYFTLGLTAGALRIKESEEFIYNAEVKNGLENLYLSFQGEHAYNVGVKGFSYTGTANNPDDTAFGNASNWTLASASVKDAAGFLIEHA
jgi:hypothetical protein